MKQGIEGLESYLDKKEAEAQKVIDGMMTELNQEPKEGWSQAGNILWALRGADRFMSAAVHMRRYQDIRTQIANLRKAEANEDPDFTKRFIEVIGEVSGDALIASIDKRFTEELIQRARSNGMRQLGESELQAASETEFLGRYLDDKPWRWF
jgi:hypothetical protein